MGPELTARSSATSSRTRPFSRPWAVATRSPSRNCTRANGCSTWGRVAASTFSCPARRVGPGGRAFGLDMTDEMLALARRNAAEAGATNVEFLKGHIEAHSVAGQLDRRRDQQLRGQPGRGQAGRLPRDRPRPAAGWPDRDQRHRGGRLPDLRAAGRARQRMSAASQGRCPSRSSRMACVPRPHRRQRDAHRSPSATGCTARSSRQPRDHPARRRCTSLRR